MTDVHFASKSQSRSSHLQHQKLPQDFSEECHQAQPGKVGENPPEAFNHLSVTAHDLFKSSMLVDD